MKPLMGHYSVYGKNNKFNSEATLKNREKYKNKRDKTGDGKICEPHAPQSTKLNTL